MFLGNSGSNHRNLSTAWIHYRKCFDSFPHSWNLKVLQLYKVSPIIVKHLKISIKEWKTMLHLNHAQGNTTCENLKTKCASCSFLSPQQTQQNWLWIANRLIKNKPSVFHGWLKLYGENEKNLKLYIVKVGRLSVGVVKMYSNDIGMEFGLDKCAKATFIREN